MTETNKNTKEKTIPSHLGGAPQSIWGWFLVLGYWLFTNVLYGFAILVAIIALWLKSSSPLSEEVVTAIMKSVSLSLMAWATALMLSSADIPKLFKYFPSKADFKAALLIATFLVFCISAIFIFQDPPDWTLYLSNPDANDKLLGGSKWISFVCLVIGGAWHVVHTLSMDKEMRLRDMGYHDDYDEDLEKMSKQARESSEAGGLKLK